MKADVKAVTDLQRMLTAAGFHTRGVDGVFGRNTIAAVISAMMDGALSIPPTTAPRFVHDEVRILSDLGPPYFAELSRLLGLAEIPGRETNPVIARMLLELNAPWSDDETPWCGTIMAHCLLATLPGEKLPSNPFAARSYLEYGQALENGALGAIMVFWRGKKKGPFGHVGGYVAEREDAFLVRGGNTNNKVGDAWIPKDRLLGIRWPSSLDLPQGGPVWAPEGSGSAGASEA